MQWIRAVFAAVAVLEPWCLSAGVRAAPSMPRFTGDSIPAPPAQKTVWAPPDAAIEDVFVSAAQALFGQGLADPRGCGYREIAVATGSCWSGYAGVVKTHGWVLPADGDSSQRFAVCWNGLVYPVVSVGDMADLRQDILPVVEADEDARLRYEKDNPGRSFYRHRHAVPEGGSVSHESMMSLKACLLLRLGEADLARKLWESWHAGMRADTNDDDVHLRDPYLMLATDWTWALFDRALCAHMRGDDNLARLSARALIPIWDAVDATAEKRGFKRPRPRRGSTGTPRYLGFLEPVYAILADQDRRAKSPATGRTPAPGEGTSPDKAQRIAALIRDLEDVSARQWGQPGGVVLAEDPIVKALIEEGDAAVEPLLDCLQNDTRLTRSVHFHRDFFRHRSLIGVHEAAYVALSGILKSSFFGVASTGDDLSSRGPEGRAAVAAKVREYWTKYRGVPLAERWYRTLADDKASANQWLQAAQSIVRPDNVSVTPGSMFGSHVTTSSSGEEPAAPRLGGESLRAGKNPSVTELMARRVERLTPAGDVRSWEDRSALRAACTLALCLVDWDLKGSVPTLRRLTRRCRDVFALGTAARRHPTPYLGNFIATFTVHRARGGERTALEEYATWIRSVSPSHLDNDVKPLFEPLWSYPNHTAIKKAAAWLFNNSASPWYLILDPLKRVGYYTTRLFKTRLIEVPAFRKQLLRALKDTREAGYITVNNSRRMSIKVRAGWTTSGPGKYEHRLPAGTTAPFRVCDIYARQIFQAHKEAPECRVFWPEKERDKAVRACEAFVRAYKVKR